MKYFLNCVLAIIPFALVVQWHAYSQAKIPRGGSNAGTDIYSGGSPTIQTDASGNVGIGTTPAQDLHLLESGGFTVRMAEDSSRYIETEVVGGAGSSAIWNIKATDNGGTLTQMLQFDGNNEIIQQATDISKLYQSHTLLTGTSFDNFSIPNDIVEFNNASAKTLSGIVAPASGSKVLYLINQNGDLTIQHENGSSSALNRINSGTSADVVISGNGGCTLVYASSRWRFLGCQL